jgi:hypothetical protein
MADAKSVDNRPPVKKRVKTGEEPLQSASHWTPATIKEFHAYYSKEPSELKSIVPAGLWYDDSDITRRTPSFPFHALNKGCDALLQEFEAIPIDLIRKVYAGFHEPGEVSADLEHLVATLGEVLVQEDEETILRDATVRRVWTRMKRDLSGTADVSARGREDLKKHKRTSSKISDKSFKSHSDFTAAAIHTVAEVTIRAIQDELARVVLKLVGGIIDWIQEKNSEKMMLSYDR